MPLPTPRLGLEKPLGSEYVSRAAFNRNYDKLDQQVAAKVDLDTHTSSSTQDVHQAKQIAYDDTATELEVANVQTAIEKLAEATSLIAGKEDKNKKGQPDGYASLDGNGKIPISQLPANVKEMRVVANIAARNSIGGENLYDGLRVHVLDATGDETVAAGWAEYVYDGTNSAWVKTAEKESMDVVIDFSNVENIPEVLKNLGDSDGKLKYKDALVCTDIRAVKFIGGESELIYDWPGIVKVVKINCSEVRTEDLLFAVEIQAKADYIAKLGQWRSVGGVLVLPAGEVYKEFPISAEIGAIYTGDVIRASTVGDDTGVSFTVVIQNN